jgi:flagellar hook-length control protein FliK
MLNALPIDITLPIMPQEAMKPVLQLPADTASFDAIFSVQLEDVAKEPAASAEPLIDQISEPRSPVIMVQNMMASRHHIVPLPNQTDIQPDPAKVEQSADKTVNDVALPPMTAPPLPLQTDAPSVDIELDIPSANSHHLPETPAVPSLNLPLVPTTRQIAVDVAKEMPSPITAKSKPTPSQASPSLPDTSSDVATRLEPKATTPQTAAAPIPAQPFSAVFTAALAPEPPLMLTEQPLMMLNNDRWLADLSSELAALPEQANRILFRLSPDNLGQLDIMLNRRDDSFAVELRAETDDAQSIIAQSLSRLEQELRVKVRMPVEAQLASNHQAPDQGQRQQQQPERGPYSMPEAITLQPKAAGHPSADRLA